MKIQNYIPTGPFWDNALSILNAWKRLGYFPNVRNPRSFNEHVLAQKYRFDGDMNLARRLTDKYEVKEWLVEMGLPELVVPTVGAFNSIAEIEEFYFKGDVIAKSTHGSGSTIIRNAKYGKAFSNYDIATMEKWLLEDYYARGREANYKGLQKRIIVEPLLLDDTGNPPKDMKIFCIKGEPVFIDIHHDRFANHTRQLYTTDWELLDYVMTFQRKPDPVKKPLTLNRALQASRLLSKGFGCVRIDFYLMGDDLKLGEMTFFPGNGAARFVPDKGDWELGSRLTQIKNNIGR